MHVTIAQLPEPPAGADRVFTSRDSVVVLDGASAFEPVSVPPGTYADHLGAAITASLSASPDEPLPAALATAIEATARELRLGQLASPSSTVAIARTSGEQLDLLVLGDSFIFYDTDDSPRVLTDARLGALDLPERRQYRQRLASGHGYDTAHRSLLRQLQRRQRQLRNQPGGYWIAAADPAAAAHAVTCSVPVSATSWAVLATDGLVHTARHLGLDDWPGIASQDRCGLTRLLRCLEDWETRTDPDGLTLCRAKAHDDKTIATLRLGTASGAWQNGST